MSEYRYKDSERSPFKIEQVNYNPDTFQTNKESQLKLHSLKLMKITDEAIEDDAISESDKIVPAGVIRLYGDHVYARILEDLELQKKYFIASNDDVSFGYAAGKDYNGNFIISRVFVEPNERRQGIGFDLVSKVIELAKKQGSKVIKTNVEEINPHYKLILKELGFEIKELDGENYTARLDLVKDSQN